MPASFVIRLGVLLSSGLALSACIPLQPEAPPAPPAPATVPQPAVIVVPTPAPPEPTDLAARRLLAYHDQLRLMSPNDLGAEISRLNAIVTSNAVAVPAESVLDLALALSMQHNGGDVARAVSLLEQLARTNTPELAPMQPMVRLLLGRVAEQRRLEDHLARELARGREQQRNLQQLNEKLEALKAIERSMNARPPSAGTPGTAPATPATPNASVPATPKQP